MKLEHQIDSVTFVAIYRSSMEWNQPQLIYLRFPDRALQSSFRFDHLFRDVLQPIIKLVNISIRRKRKVEDCMKLPIEQYNAVLTDE